VIDRTEKERRLLRQLEENVPVEVLQLTPFVKKGDDELHRKYAVRRRDEISDRDKWARPAFISVK
jgi:hypothetical protein